MINYLSIFGFKIYFYGILITLGALAAAYLARSQARKHGQDPEIVWDIFIWVLIAGVIGARIWHILTPPPSMVELGITTHYYLTHPIEMLKIRNGGLGIPGAIIAGGLALYVYARVKKLNFGMWADFAVPGVALAQAIGRWGNFFNQEVYGKPSTLPWAITIAPEYRLPDYQMFSTYHPLFLYESLWNLLNMGILLYLDKRLSKWLRHGDLFLMYLMMYGVGRFGLEFLRLDSAQVAGINANQTVVIVVALASAAIMIWRHRTEINTQAKEAATPSIDKVFVDKTTKKAAKPVARKPKTTAKTPQNTTSRKSTKTNKA
jgi:phosphatidylglycerol:prolipoprotein diacylglycerol transferase